MSSKSKKSFLIVFSLLVLIAALAIPVLAFATNAEEEHDSQEQTSEQNTPQEQNAEGDGLLAGIQDFINNILPNEDPNYLYFEPETPGQECSFTLEHQGNAPDVTLQYSFDPSGPWLEYVDNTSVNFSQRVYLKGVDNNTFAYDGNNRNVFKFNGENRVRSGGSIMSLLNGDGNETEITAYCCFGYLFYENDLLVSMPELPATNLTSSCYHMMFAYCSNLSEVSYISAKDNLPNFCFYGMFAYCSKITITPQFEISSFVNNDIEQCGAMFINCTSLNKLNCKLSANNLTERCYNGMFSNTNIEKAPYLPAKNLGYNCYARMFKDCSSLTEVTVAFENWNESATENWLQNVSTDGNLFAPSSLLEPTERGASTLPEGWILVYRMPIVAEVNGYFGSYDGEEHGISIIPDIPENPKVEYSTDGSIYQEDSITFKNSGKYIVFYKLSAEGYADTKGSATVEITPSTSATVKFDKTSYSKDYGNEDPPFVVNFTGIMGSEPVEGTDYVITRQHGENASATGYEVKFNWLRDNNYAFPETKTTLTINKTKNFKLVADPASKSSSSDDPTFTAHMEGLKFNDKFTDSDYVVTAQENYDNSTKTLNPALTDSGKAKFGTNYDITDPATYIVTSTLEIYSGSSITYKTHSYSAAYDGQKHKFEVIAEDFPGATIQYSVDPDHETWDGNPPEFKNAGEYEIAFKITCEGYDDVQDTATLTIFKKDATIVANAAYKNEGEAEPELTAQVLGLVDGESLQPQVDYQLVRDEGEAPGVYEIHCNLLSNAVTDNYNIETTDSKFFVLGQGTPTPTPDPPSPEEINSNVAQTGDNLANTIATVIAVIAILGCLSYLVLQVRRKQ